MGTAYNTPRIITDNLISFLDAGNTKSYPGSGTTWTDLTGNGNNAQLQNSSNISYSSNEGCLILDTSASSNFPYILRLTDYVKDVNIYDFTIEHWVNIYLTADDETGTLWRNTPSNVEPYSENANIILQDNKIKVSNWFAASDYTTPTSLTFVDSSAQYTSSSYNGWEHLVFSRIGMENNNMRFYRNNSLVHTWTNKLLFSDANTNTDSNRALFGSSVTTGIRGKIGIYRFYHKKGFTAAEVKQNFDASKRRYGL